MTRDSTAVYKRYTRRLLAIMVVYLTALIGGQLAIKEGIVPASTAIPIAVTSGLCIVLTFVVMGRLMVEMQDEFLRMLFVRQTLIAAGFALSLAAIHGFLTDFDLADHIDAYWWPVLFFAGQFIGQVANRIQYGTWGMLR